MLQNQLKIYFITAFAHDRQHLCAIQQCKMLLQDFRIKKGAKGDKQNMEENEIFEHNRMY